MTNTKPTRKSKSRLVEKIAESSKVKRIRRANRDYTGHSGYNGYFDPSQSDLERRDYNWEMGR